MKKFLSALALCLCLMGTILLAGCDPKISSVQLVNGSITTTILVNTQLDTTNAKATVFFEDKTSATIEADQLTFGSIDTSTAGNKTLTVTYQDYTFEVIIKVVAAEVDLYEVASFESNLLTNFTYNFSKTNANEQYVTNKSVITVGDDNKVDFDIVAKTLDSSNNPVSVTARTLISLELKSADTYTAVANTAEYATIDTANTTIDFNDNAIGKTFRVTIKPKNIMDGISEEEVTLVCELQVVDGYNVYNAHDLSVFDNANLSAKEGSKSPKWTTLKTEWGLMDVDAKNVILLRNISITKDDIPADSFWTTSSNDYDTYASQAIGVSVEGSLIDRRYSSDAALESIYFRFIGDDDDFTFYGNGFTVDAHEIPLVVVDDDNVVIKSYADTRDGEQSVTSHTCIFKVQGGEYDNDTKSYSFLENDVPTRGTSCFRDITFIGNGKRTDESKYSGGIILSKAWATNFTAENTIYKNFFIGYYVAFGMSNEAGREDSKYIIKDTKGFNNYNTHLYCWGAHDVLLENCTMQRAGGPVIIATHANTNDYNQSTGEGGHPTFINAVNCTLESYVVGTEPWFAQYSAAPYVQQIATADALYNGQAGLASGKTILKDYDPQDGSGVTPNAMNMIVIYLNGATKSFTPYVNRGYVRIFDNQQDYENYYSTTNPQKTTYGLDLGTDTFGDGSACSTKPFTVTGNPVYFESSNNGGYINSSVQTNGDTSYTSNKSYTDGKFVNIYLAGVGAMIELFNK